MEIGKNLAANILRYKLDHKLSTIELAAELHLAVSTTQEYLNGGGNPRADTLELLARQMGISVTELISSPISGLEQATSVFRAAKECAALPPDKREKGIQLFLEMVDLWSQDSSIHTHKISEVTHE